jgi:hypothetical protein
LGIWLNPGFIMENLLKYFRSTLVEIVHWKYCIYDAKLNPYPPVNQAGVPPQRE